VARLRAALVEAVSPADVKAIARRLVKQALAGDVAAARTLFDRLLGPCEAADALERLERLEGKLGIEDTR